MGRIQDFQNKEDARLKRLATIKKVAEKYTKTKEAADFYAYIKDTDVNNVFQAGNRVRIPRHYVEDRAVEYLVD
jgi:hypothetical protein